VREKKRWRKEEKWREREEEEENNPPSICSASATACKIPTAMIEDLRKRRSRMACN
jgi:hypothetical protein